MKRRRLIILSFAALIVSAVATPADAATIAGSDAYGLGSAQIDGGAVYWAQTYGNYYFASPQGPNRLLRRDLSSNSVETVFEAGQDDVLSAFNAVNGRIIVGSRNRIDGSSSVLEVKRDPSGVSTVVLATRTSGYNGQTCHARVRPIGINAQGEAMVEELRRVSTDGNCAAGLIKRTVSTITAIAPDGASRMLVERKSGWSTYSEDTDLGRPRWGGGDWMALLPGEDSSDAVFLNGGMLNLSTGGFTKSQSSFSSSSDVEFSRDGRALSEEDGDGATLYFNPLSPTSSRRLTVRRSFSWMHFCGDKILEISRREGRYIKRRFRYTAGGKQWNIYIRNLDGARERRLTQRLARGTNFGGCNADTAVFHKYARRGDRARQFSVPLSPPAA